MPIEHEERGVRVSFQNIHSRDAMQRAGEFWGGPPRGKLTRSISCFLCAKKHGAGRSKREVGNEGGRSRDPA